MDSAALCVLAAEVLREKFGGTNPDLEDFCNTATQPSKVVSIIEDPPEAETYLLIYHVTTAAERQVKWEAAQNFSADMGSTEHRIFLHCRITVNQKTFTRVLLTTGPLGFAVGAAVAAKTGRIAFSSLPHYIMDSLNPDSLPAPAMISIEVSPIFIGAGTEEDVIRLWVTQGVPDHSKVLTAMYVSYVSSILCGDCRWMPRFPCRDSLWVVSC